MWSDPLATAYLDHCTAERHPPNTIRSRRRTLRTLGNPGTATREEVETWWRTRADLAVSTRIADLSNLRAFYRWAQRWERRADDPTLRLDSPRAHKGVPRPASRDELRRILDAMPDDLRRAVCLGAYAGLRVSEAAALMWSEVDTEARRVYVIDSKGGKSRAVRVSAVLVDQLLPDTGGNVVTGTTAVTSAGRLQRRINRAMGRVAPGVTFHRLRHRFGVLAYEATGDLLGVGQALGHSSPISTAIYAQATDAVADRIAAAVVR